MTEFIEGMMILFIPLSAAVILLFKWWKDYQRTRKILVLYDKKTKYWLIIFIPLLVILISTIWVSFFEVESSPIKIRIEEWNPWGWYG